MGLKTKRGAKAPPNGYKIMTDDIKINRLRHALEEGEESGISGNSLDSIFDALQKDN